MDLTEAPRIAIKVHTVACQWLESLEHFSLITSPVPPRFSFIKAVFVCLYGRECSVTVERKNCVLSQWRGKTASISKLTEDIVPSGPVDIFRDFKGLVMSVELL